MLLHLTVMVEYSRRNHLTRPLSAFSSACFLIFPSLSSSRYTLSSFFDLFLSHINLNISTCSHFHDGSRDSRLSLIATMHICSEFNLVTSPYLVVFTFLLIGYSVYSGCLSFFSHVVVGVYL
jgi:hypothetical protein